MAGHPRVGGDGVDGARRLRRPLVWWTMGCRLQSTASQWAGSSGITPLNVAMHVIGGHCRGSSRSSGDRCSWQWSQLPGPVRMSWLLTVTEGLTGYLAGLEVTADVVSRGEGQATCSVSGTAAAGELRCSLLGISVPWGHEAPSITDSFPTRSKHKE